MYLCFVYSTGLVDTDDEPNTQQPFIDMESQPDLSQILSQPDLSQGVPEFDSK
jgi:hypothetical protein